MAKKQVKANPYPRVQWTSEMEERLVELWQEHECIYNVSSKNYHNRFEKENCWIVIANALGQQGNQTVLG